jgi:hypothetical protein
MQTIAKRMRLNLEGRIEEFVVSLELLVIVVKVEGGGR